MINQERMIEIGSAICLLEPIFLSYTSLDKVTIVIDGNSRGKTWWALAYSLTLNSNYYYEVNPINYLNETHVLLSYFYEEFLYSDVHSKKCQEFIRDNFKLQNNWLHVYKYSFELGSSAHHKFRAITTLRNWLEEKNLPKSDIDYLVNLKRIQSLNKQNKSIYGAS